MTTLSQQWLGSMTWQQATWALKGIQAQLWWMAAGQAIPGTLPDDDVWLRKALNLPTAAAGKRAKRAVMEAAEHLQTPTLDALTRDALKKTSKKLSHKAVTTQVVQSPLGWEEAHARVLDALCHGLINPELQDATQEAWLDHLWTHHWKSYVLEDWKVIDEELMLTYPHLRKVLKKGQTTTWLFHPLAYALTQTPIEVAHPSLAASEPKTSSKRKGTAKTARKAKSVQRTMSSQVFSQGMMNPAHQPGLLGLRPMGLMLSKPLMKLDERRLLQIWKPALSESEKTSMWERGIRLLKTSAQSEAQTRAALGRLIKQHGEAAVHQALSALSRRHMPPADPLSFVQKMLQESDRSSPSEQKARQQRSKVAI